MRSRRSLPILALALLAGCQSTNNELREAGTSIMGSAPGLEAPLVLVGMRSNPVGTVKFLDKGDGTLVMYSMTNVLPGTYRMAIHRDGNCTSSNAFSAGPPWAPPGVQRSAETLFPEFHTGSEGDVSWTVRVPGLRTDGEGGLMGRSVVVHWGTKVDQAMPGLPNNRVLCGVIGPIRSFFN
jgi:Cu/Zn superoxide dismutase